MQLGSLGLLDRKYKTCLILIHRSTDMGQLPFVFAIVHIPNRIVRQFYGKIWQISRVLKYWRQNIKSV